MEYNIREIQEKDYLEVARLYKGLRKVSEIHMFEFYTKLMKKAGMKSDEFVTENIIKSKHLKDNSKFLILEIDNNIVGFIYGTLFYPSDDCIYNRDIYDYIGGELNHIFIDEKYRGFGFSSKLRDELFKWFKENKVGFVEIGVNTTNPVFKTYEKWGFVSKYQRISKEI